MRLFISMIATVAMCLSASTALAAAFWTVDTSASSGDLNALNVGDQIILDITLRTDDFALALAGSVNNYDNSVVGLDSSASLISGNVLNQICIPGIGCFGGILNHIGASIPFQERAVGPGVEVEFMAGLSLSPAGGQGELDPGIVTGGTGEAQFRIIYTALAPGTTVFQIGTYEEYLDGYTGTVDSLSNNTTLTVTVAAIPEPGTALLMGLGLAGLATAGRRE